MLRRSTIIALEILVGLFAISAIGVGILIWRLTSGPVALDFLTPHLSAAFEDAVESTRAEIGETVLLWQGWKRPVRLTARDVRLLDLEGQIGVRLPEVSLRLSLSALLRGVVAPTIIELRDASFLLQRKADGSLIFSQREGEENYKQIPGAAPTGGISSLVASLRSGDLTFARFAEVEFGFGRGGNFYGIELEGEIVEGGGGSVFR